MKKHLKKILYLCSVYKPNIGGTEIAIENLTKNLHEANIDTTVFTKKFPFNLSEKESINNSIVLRMNRPKNTLEYLKSIKFIKKHLNLLKADVIHLIGIRRPMPLYGLLLSKLWQVPYVVTFTGGDLPDPLEPDSIRIWNEGKDITPQSVLQADKLTAFSRYTASLAEKAIGLLPNIDVIYGGIDLDEINKSPKQIEKFEYFFAARRLDPSKGIDILIRAYHKIKRKFPNTKLLIAGEGPDRQLLTELVHKLKLENNVVFLGPLSHSKVISYMKGAVAHICPSRTEGGGIVNYEAQAAGCLAIGSNAGGIPEYIENNKTGFIFPAGDENALTKLLSLSIKNRKEVERIKKTAKNEIYKKTWDTFSHIYLKIYKNLYEKYKYKPLKPWNSLVKKMWKELTNGR